MHRAGGDSLQAQRNHSALELFKLTAVVLFFLSATPSKDGLTFLDRGHASAGQPTTQLLKLFAFFSKLCGNCTVSWKGHALRELEDDSLCGQA